MASYFENPVNENAYEASIIELFQNMGYVHVYGPDIDNRDFTSPLYDEVLEEALVRLNPKLPQAAINEALFKLRNFAEEAISFSVKLRFKLA